MGRKIYQNIPRVPLGTPFALSLTKNEVDAHDLVMELFVKLLEWPESRIEFLRIAFS